MQKTDKLMILAGILFFGSIWGMLECFLGSVNLTGSLQYFPMGALLGGFFGLGIMAFSRRLYGLPWMQLGMGVIAGLVRYWAPIGQCVICSALAITAESLVFELIFNRKVFDISKMSASPLLDMRSLATTGVIAGYLIYVSGYMFTQFFTPIIAMPHAANLSNFAAALPLIFGRGFFAALFGGVALPLVMSVKQLHIDVSAVRKKLYYPTTAGVSALCWILVIVAFTYPH